MNLKLVFSVVFLIILFVCPCQALVNTRFIDEVIKKDTLSESDFKVIDDFWEDAIGDIVNATDFTSIAQIRTIIVVRKHNQSDYAQKYSESAKKHISAGLENARTQPSEHRFKVATNLLILIYELKDPALAGIAIEMLNDNNQAVRYWAVRALTDDDIINKLASGPNANQVTVQQIIDRLDDIAANSSPETLRLIINFCSKRNPSAVTQLLLKIADARIQAYLNWSVEYELIEDILLKQLANQINASGANKAEVGKKFGQLFSLVIQRYINGRGYLSDANGQRLASVIIDVEEKCLRQILGTSQTTLKRAIEANDFPAIENEHNRLLGSSTQMGMLPATLSFTYSSNGIQRNYPVELSPPPQKITE
jgi:hypothetical protein